MNSTGKTVTLFGTEYQVADEHDGLITIQELKSFLPEMESELYAQLKEDISQHGIHDPILFKEIPEVGNLVIEGHTRLQAAIELGHTGEEIPRKLVQEDFVSINDIKLWMLKHQFQRRNLSSVEKLKLAMLSKDTIEAKAKENLSKAGKDIAVEEPIDTAKEIANLAGVSRATTIRYMTVIEKAPEKIKEKMHKGDVSIFSAYKSVERSPSLKFKADQFVSHRVRDYDEGKSFLDEGRVEVLVVLKDEKIINSFNTTQRNKFGFLILSE
ncbi:MAG TPA: hypothetical protein PLQ69_09370 [Paludibacter sp.]|nr:hypothetical protein [Paludibacter sp.]